MNKIKKAVGPLYQPTIKISDLVNLSPGLHGVFTSVATIVLDSIKSTHTKKLHKWQLEAMYNINQHKRMIDKINAQPPEYETIFNEDGTSYQKEIIVPYDKDRLAAWNFEVLNANSNSMLIYTGRKKNWGDVLEEYHAFLKTRVVSVNFDGDEYLTKASSEYKVPRSGRVKLVPEIIEQDGRLTIRRGLPEAVEIEILRKYKCKLDGTPYERIWRADGYPIRTSTTGVNMLTLHSEILSRERESLDDNNGAHK
ncbi:hypothetical protein AGMMS50268_07680 [Spirochaetia bacterium]|nr:hypothetical protein AGMMS50268_07680 [Spirochaetia bacterium]